MELPDIKFDILRNGLRIGILGLDDVTVLPSSEAWTAFEETFTGPLGWILPNYASQAKHYCDES